MVDDHPMVRQGLRAIVEQFEGLQVVGEAADGREGVRLAQSLRPDVVVMDVNMPTMDGVEATRQITATCPSIVVIGLSVHNSPQVESAMKEAGAAAYLTKDAAPEQLQQAISSAILQKRTTT
jgi:DNA-binding NarL/FixJ family response regulator